MSYILHLWEDCIVCYYIDVLVLSCPGTADISSKEYILGKLQENSSHFFIAAVMNDCYSVISSGKLLQCLRIDLFALSLISFGSMQIQK